jgi:CAAX protease family protein
LVSTLKPQSPAVAAAAFTPWAAVALSLAVMAASLFGGNAIAGLLLGGPAGDDLITAIARRAVIYLFLFSPLYAFAFIAHYAFNQQQTPQRYRLSVATSLLIGCAIGLTAFAITLALAFFAGVVRAGSATAGASIAGIVFAAGLTVWQAGAEECLFRGWLQPVLTKSWGALPGIAVAALAFATAHAFLESPSPLAMFNTFLAGCVFGAIVWLTGRVSSAIAAHATWNWVEQSIAGLTPNPGVDSLTSVFDLDLAGPSLISGAGDGLTGSLATTVILAVTFAALAAVGVSGIRARDH